MESSHYYYIVSLFSVLKYKFGMFSVCYNQNIIIIALMDLLIIYFVYFCIVCILIFLFSCFFSNDIVDWYLQILITSYLECLFNAC